MRTLIYILQKEFIQIFRNKGMLPVIFIMPLIQMLILVFAATNELTHVDIAIVDFDHSASSRRLTGEIKGNPFFRVRQETSNSKDAEDLLLRNKINLALIIPQSFEKDLTLGNAADVQVLVDAINGTSAQLSFGYLSNIIGSYSKNVLTDNAANSLKISEKPEPFNRTLRMIFTK